MGLRSLAPLLLALVLAPARADELQRTWELSHEAMFLDALYGGPAAAVRRYEALLHEELSAGDPSLSRTLYHLAYARYVMGDVDGAREALDACIRSGHLKADCLDLRSRIDLDAEGVHAVPTRWTFDDEDHGVFHPRIYWDKGSIRIADRDGDALLAWSTAVDGARPDRLVVGFRNPTPPPQQITWEIESAEIEAAVRLELVDIDGHVYTPANRRIALPRGQRHVLRVVLAEAVPVDRTSPPLDPARLHRMHLIDVTGTTGQLGRNELHIHRFEVR